MKYYDNSGVLWDSPIAASIMSFTNRVNDWADRKLQESLEIQKEIKKVNGFEDIVNDTFGGAMYSSKFMNDDTKNDIKTSEVIETMSDEVAEAIVIDNSGDINKQHIDIDYAHGMLHLTDDNGNEIASSPISSKLIGNTVDQMMMDIIYPDGNIPNGEKMYIASKGNVTCYQKPSAEETIIPMQDESIKE